MQDADKNHVSATTQHLAVMEDLSDDEIENSANGIVENGFLNLATSEVHPFPSIPYEEPILYRHQKGFKRYQPTIRALVPSKIPENDRDVLPSDRVGLWSMVTFSWLTKMLWQLFRKGASAFKMYRCPIMESCSLNSQRMEYLWQEELQKNGLQKDSLSRAVSKFLRTRKNISAFLFTLGLMIGIITPVYFVYKLLEFISDENAPLLTGLLYVIAICAIETVRMFIFSLQWAINIRTGLRLRSALTGVIIRKIIRQRSLGHKSVGEIINLFANDSSRILEYTLLGHLWIGGTVVTVLSLAYVFWVLGVLAFASVGVFISFYIAMFCVSKLIGYYRRRAVRETDERVRQMTEILNCMKIIKLYGWEESFMKCTTAIRERERSNLEKMAFLQSVSMSSSNAVPIMAAVVSFMTCLSLGQPLTPSEAFSILGALLLSRAGLLLLPVTAGKIAEFRNTLTRIQKVLVMEDVGFVPLTPSNPDNAIELRNASFTWVVSVDPPALEVKRGKRTNKLFRRNQATQKDTEDSKCLTRNNTNSELVPTLRGIDLIITKGRLIGVCGTVASGKSSLVSAILGQMKLAKGDLAVGGTCAYVAQQAWIMNETLETNITLGGPVDKKRLDEAVECCGLSDDIKNLPGGLKTEIGERGVNLSGGQKQRVSLARAVYCDRDIYLLDDPLSAVDYRVGSHIFRRCIKGFLANKTVLFVSHQIQYLENCDEIIVMKDGCISEHGTPLEVKNNAGTYADLLAILRAQQEAVRDQTAGRIKRGNSTENDVPQSPRLERAGSDDGVESDTGIRITVDETMAKGSISNATYMAYIRAMGGIPAALSVFLLIGLSLITTAASNWWLSVMLSRNSEVGNYQPNRTFVNYSDTNLTASLTLNDTDEITITSPMVNQNDLIIYGSMLIAIILACLLRAWSYVKGTFRASTILHKELLDRVINSPMRFFEAVPIGRTINLFSKDMDEVDTALTAVMEMFLALSWANIVSLLLVVLVFPWFLIPLVVALVTFAAYTAIFQASLREIKRLENLSRSPVFGHINAMVQGLSTIHAYDKEKDFVRRFIELQDENTVLLNMFYFASRWVALRLDLVVVFILVSTALCTVLLKGSSSAAFAGLALSYTAQLGGMLHFLIRNMAETRARFTNVERLVHQIKNSVREGGDIVPSITPPLNWPFEGEIEFLNVELRYRKELSPALKDVTFRVASCEKVGIVGRTGSGKSSLGVALFRLVELSNGTISIDGLDISKITLKQLRSQLSLIPQDPVLFSGTIRSNLDPFQKYSDEDVWEALSRTRLSKKIDSLDNQLLAPVIENGENFSVGERQLLCLARALLRKSKIILLDEATASVDARTDAMVQEILQEAFSSCTILTIAHRIHTVLHYDRILVLKNGKVQKFDTPQALRSNPDSYISLLLRESEQQSC